MPKAFDTGYERPSRLSDSYNDFSQEMLTELLEMKDEDLDWVAFIRLFQPRLPAGTYEEIVYFLPFALAHVQEHEADLGAEELAEAILLFCSQNAQQLSNDGLIPAVTSAIKDCLSYWTREFNLSPSATPDYYVVNSVIVFNALSVLIKSEVLRDIALEFIKSLTLHEDNATRAYWFLEFSRVFSSIDDTFIDKEKLEEAYEFVCLDALSHKHPYDFWERICDKYWPVVKKYNHST